MGDQHIHNNISPSVSKMGITYFSLILTWLGKWVCTQVADNSNWSPEAPVAVWARV